MENLSRSLVERKVNYLFTIVICPGVVKEKFPGASTETGVVEQDQLDSMNSTILVLERESPAFKRSEFSIDVDENIIWNMFIDDAAKIVGPMVRILELPDDAGKFRLEAAVLMLHYTDISVFL
jgi:hypothetical protein|tara:strand:+ start:98 stop:466 length:369 start_codon:yes stop_codon:yes gene_type:complete